MTELYERLCSDLRNEILRLLPYDRNNQTIVCDLEQKRTDDLLIHFLNWINRLIHPHPRNVVFSEELLLNPILPQYEQRIVAIANKIKHGNDITPHLSARVSIGYASTQKKKNLNARQDLDMLLNDWGIHHLHLSDSIASNGFVTRNRKDTNLLFAIFLPDTSYFLNILAHGDWGDDELVKIAVRNWPNDELFLDLRGILPGQPSETDRQYSKIRGVGLSTSVNVDGIIYISRTLGISCAGTATRSSLEAIRFLQHLKTVCEEIQKNPLYLKPYVEKAGGVWPDCPTYKLVFSSGPERYTFSIFVENADTGIGIWPLYA